MALKKSIASTLEIHNLIIFDQLTSKLKPKNNMTSKLP
jgi:hypothetical protein